MHSDVYVGEARPEIIVPRTDRLGGYARIVATLIDTFARVAGQDDLTVYRSLVTGDRDVVRVRAAESEDGSVTLNDGVDLIGGMRGMLLSVAWSLREPQPLYLAGANRDAAQVLKRVCLGQTDRAASWSANLCEALVRIIEPFPTLDVGVSWARTRPVAAPGTVARFCRAGAALLREAARSLRERAPRPEVRLHGFVRLLKHGEADYDGTIRLATDIDGQRQSVVAVLEQADYERAVQAHRDRAPVVLAGDLERTGQRWRLLNPHVERVLRDDGPESGDP